MFGAKMQAFPIGPNTAPGSDNANIQKNLCNLCNLWINKLAFPNAPAKTSTQAHYRSHRPSKKILVICVICG